MVVLYDSNSSMLYILIKFLFGESAIVADAALTIEQITMLLVHNNAPRRTD
jgi:hypothetical protein